MWGEMIFTVYIDEDDGQPTHIVQHPLESEIRRTLKQSGNYIVKSFIYLIKLKL